MSRGLLRFKETEVRRFLRAFTKEGLPVAEVMVDSDGNLTALIPCPPSEETAEDAELDRELDAIKEAHPE